MDIIFDLSESRSSGRPAAFVVGTMTAPLLVTPPVESSYLGVRFHPGGAQPLFGLPMHELTDLRVDLSSISRGCDSGWWKSLASEWSERLRQEASNDDRIRLLDELLAQKLFAVSRPEPRVRAAAQRIRRVGGRISVEDLSHGFGLTRQHLTRLFERHIGIGVKRFSRIIRMQSVLSATSRTTGMERSTDWASLAVEYGYFDQAHLSTDFKGLTGLTPEKFLRSS